MTQFSYQTREKLLSSIESNHYDVVIIGGGITGCGIALDSVSRGYKTLLLEMQDLASGTSSRSTKLVHGGLRYLKQLDVSTVAEVGKEREIVYNNAKHVTTPEWMMLPFYKGGTFGKYSTSLGLRVYDFLAGVKKAERRKMLSIEEAKKREPLLKDSGLQGAGYYVEYRTDDARLTLEVAKKAVELGADIVTYAKVEEFLMTDRKLKAVKFKDVLHDQPYTVKGNVFINAAGPWVESIIQLDKPIPGKKLMLTKGVHLVFDQKKFPLQQAIYFDSPDKRMIFAIPRDGKTYIGTTDTKYTQDLTNPTIEQADKDYILHAANDMFPTLDLTNDDIESAWSGIRPLIHQEGKGPSEISRKDEIWQSDSGLFTIAGGKLTGYRKMAEAILDKVESYYKPDKTIESCQTKSMRLSGGDFTSVKDLRVKFPYTNELEKAGLTQEEYDLILSRYGSNAGKVLSYVETIQSQRIPSSLLAMLDYGIHYEMVLTPTDFFVRRTGNLLFDIATVKKYKLEIIDYMKERFGWDVNRTTAYLNELDERVAEV